MAIKFLADMGIAMRVIHWLREQGYDAIHLREEGLQRLPDKEIFEKAYLKKRVLLTFDLDFGEIMAFSKNKPVSVILFRLHNTRTPFVIERLKRVLKDTQEILEERVIIVVEDTRFRIRHI